MSVVTSTVKGMRTVPADSTTAPAPAPRPSAPLAPHHTNRALGEALFAAASGDRIIVVTAPPGAGKTFTIAHLAHQLATRMGLRIAVAAQTRVQGFDVANRIVALGVPTRHLRGRTDPRPAGLSPEVVSIAANPRMDGPGVTVATAARWRITPTDRYRADLLLVDEAYQMTYADLIALGDLADQIALVGDPGQIAPVVTGSTRRWDGTATAPNLPAPLALAAAHPSAITHVRLTETHRLGPATTALIAPLYPSLPFTSVRPDSHLDLLGQRLPEHRALATSPLDHTDPDLAETAARAAREMLAATVTDPHGTRPMTPGDLAVITPHVHQAALVAARLADLPGVLVATANAAQGLERHAVVALHPLAGYRETPDFALDTGRLCVSLSRHRSHLTVVTDTRTEQAFARSYTEATAGQREVIDLHRAILTNL